MMWKAKVLTKKKKNTTANSIENMYSGTLLEVNMWRKSHERIR